MMNGKPNPPNMRRRRYSRWLDKAAKLLMETNEAKTTQQLLNELPDDRHTPANVGSAFKNCARINALRTTWIRFMTSEDRIMKSHFGIL